MVRARPVATWLDCRPSTRIPKIADIPAPAMMPARIPRNALPVWCTVANATTAPTSIIPSTPRLSTPDFSVTISPMAANRSGVAAVMIVSRVGTRISIRPP